VGGAADRATEHGVTERPDTENWDIKNQAVAERT
jgi:hypothetical protein